MGQIVSCCVCCQSNSLDASPAIWMPFVSHRALGLPPLAIDASWGLRTIPEGMAYSLCKSLHCRDCGHLFVDYRFDDKEMQRLYTGYRGEDYSLLRSSYEPEYAEFNRLLSAGSGFKSIVESFLGPYLPPHSLSILDWGGDTGANTPFEHRRHCLDIYDPSEKPLRHGTAISIADLSSTKQYDLVVLAEVLEHIPFPEETIRMILPRMSADTVLYVEFPFEKLQRDSEPVKLPAAKRYWHEHINLFSFDSALKLFERCGLKLLQHQILSLDAALFPSTTGDHKIFMFALRKSACLDL